MNSNDKNKRNENIKNVKESFKKDFLKIKKEAEVIEKLEKLSVDNNKKIIQKCKYKKSYQLR